MFARKVAVRLKPNALRQFVNLVDYQILPWLRTQPGFLDLITLATPDDSEVATISFWDQEGNAQAYSSTGYPETLKLLESILDGIPYVKTYNVVLSTFQEVAAVHPSERKNPEAQSADDETGPRLAYRAYETSA